MQTTSAGNSEVAIFGRVLDADQAPLSAAAALAILKFGFSTADQQRMIELSAKAGEGMLNSAEQLEMNNYEVVGHILSLMKSKARRSLTVRDANVVTVAESVNDHDSP